MREDVAIDVTGYLWADGCRINDTGDIIYILLITEESSKLCNVGGRKRFIVCQKDG